MGSHAAAKLRSGSQGADTIANMKLESSETKPQGSVVSAVDENTTAPQRAASSSRAPYKKPRIIIVGAYREQWLKNNLNNQIFTRQKLARVWFSKDPAHYIKTRDAPFARHFADFYHTELGISNIRNWLRVHVIPRKAWATVWGFYMGLKAIREIKEKIHAEEEKKKKAEANEANRLRLEKQWDGGRMDDNEESMSSDVPNEMDLVG